MDSQPHLDEHAAAPSGQPCVCVVDEDERSAQMLAVLLQMDGYAAGSSNGGRIMERLLEPPRPQVLVMSVSMGRGDMVRSIRQIREQHPALPIVLITEHPHLMQRLGSQGEPLPVVLTKPVDYPALLVALRGVLTTLTPRPHM